MQKVLLLDGISGVPMGKELADALERHGMSVEYRALRSLPAKPFYPLRSAVKKAVNKRESSDSFYYLPKSDPKQLEQAIRDYRPDIVLVIGFLYRFVDPSSLQKMKSKLGFALYLYDTDSCNFYPKRREFIFFLETELPVYDHIFSFSQVTTRFFRNTRKLAATFFPFGATELPATETGATPVSVLFVGSADLRRIFLLEHIADQVTVYGDRWSRNEKLMSDRLKTRVIDHGLWGDELHNKLQSSKIVLNITRTQFYGAETGINLRVFEALAAGCLLLTDYCDELAELFVIGEEIEVFRGSRELKDKVAYYLEHPAEREHIARRGHEKFLAHYTWDARAKDLIGLIRDKT